MSNQISNKGCADFALVTDWTNLLCNWICWEVVRIDVVQKLSLSVFELIFNCVWTQRTAILLGILRLQYVLFDHVLSLQYRFFDWIDDFLLHTEMILCSLGKSVVVSLHILVALVVTVHFLFLNCLK